MKTNTLLGIVLIVIGIIAFGYQGISTRQGEGGRYRFPSHDAEKTKTLPSPMWGRLRSWAHRAVGPGKPEELTRGKTGFSDGKAQEDAPRVAPRGVDQHVERARPRPGRTAGEIRRSRRRSRRGAPQRHRARGRSPFANRAGRPRRGAVADQVPPFLKSRSTILRSAEVGVGLRGGEKYRPSCQGGTPPSHEYEPLNLRVGRPRGAGRTVVPGALSTSGAMMRNKGRITALNAHAKEAYEDVSSRFASPGGSGDGNGLWKDV